MSRTSSFSQRLRQFGERLFFGGMLSTAVVLPIISWSFFGVSDLARVVVLSLGILVAMIGFFGRFYGERNVSLVWSPALGFIVLMFVAGALSAFFGASPWTSIFGDTGEMSHSLAVVAAFVLFGGLWAQLLSSYERMRGRVTDVIMIAGGLSVVLSFAGVMFPTVLGAWQPARQVGGVTAVAVIVCAMAMTEVTFSAGRRRLIYAVVSAGSFLALVSLHSVMAWLVLSGLALAGLLVLLFRPSLLPSPIRAMVPLLALGAALFFAAAPSPLPSPYGPEVTLSSVASWRIFQSAARDSAYVLGAGPATYGVSYERLEDARMNQTGYWNAVFPSASSEVLTFMTTWGLLAESFMIAFLVFIGVAAWRRSGGGLPSVPPALWMGWGAVLLAQVFFVSDFLVVWLFVLLTASVFVYGARTATLAISRVGTGTTWVVLRGAMVLVVLAFALRSAGMTWSLWLANRSLRMNPERAERALVAARRLAPRNDLVQRAVALAAVRGLQGVSADQADSLRAFVELAADSTRSAIHVGGGQPENWRVRARVLESLVPFAPDAQAASVEAWREVAKRAPADPVSRTEAAMSVLRSLEGKKDAAKDARLAQVEADLQGALRLKSDYLPAQFGLAMLDRVKGDVGAAEDRFLRLLRVVPNDVAVIYELGRLHAERKEYDEALTYFNRAREISPTFSNAHWQAALALEAKGDKAGALTALKTILSYDAQNAAVLQKLKTMQVAE